jgi:hypoxanthine phosphoribosyltransferase
MTEKAYIRADDLVYDSFLLARMILDSGYRPDVILVLWRGGTPVGVVVHEFLLYNGVESYHTVVKAESYTGIGERHEPVIENLDRVAAKLDADTRVLVVDDIFDTGGTLSRVAETLGARTPHIRLATLYLHRGHNRTNRLPDFYLRRTDRWVVFPHEVVGLSPEEIRRKDPRLADVLRCDARGCYAPVRHPPRRPPGCATGARGGAPPE